MGQGSATEVTFLMLVQPTVFFSSGDECNMYVKLRMHLLTGTQE